MALGLKGNKKLIVRFSRNAKQTLLAAAKASHQSFSVFVTTSALVNAREVLANRCTFGLR